MYTSAAVLGIDLNAQQMTVLLLRADHTPIASAAAVTPLLEGADAILAELIQLCLTLRHEAEQHHLEVVTAGLGLPVQLIADGIIRAAPPSLKSWLGWPLAEATQAALHLPVVIERSIHVIALSEALYGAGQPFKQVVYVGLGSELEVAFVRDGIVWQGVRGGAGGIGALLADWRGEKPVTLSEIASADGLVRTYQSRSRHSERRPRFDELTQYAAEGNMLAIKVLRESARICGQVLSPAIAVIDPEAVILGGSVPTAHPVWWETFTAAFYENRRLFTHDMPLLPAANTHQPVALGAALLALNRLSPTG